MPSPGVEGLADHSWVKSRSARPTPPSPRSSASSSARSRWWRSSPSARRQAAEGVELRGEGEEGVASAKKAALETLPTDGVELLQQMNMDRWMQEAIPACESHALTILFSDKPSVPPLFRALSIEFEGKIGFGMAQAGDAAIAQRFNVQKAPTLLVLFPDASKKDENGNMQLAGMQFDPRVHGKFNFANLATFMSGVVEMRMQQLERQGSGAAGGAGEEGKQQQREPRVPKDVALRPSCPRTISRSECVSKGGLCGIALLDGSAENAASKENALSMLTKLRSRKAGGPISFSWIDATCHLNFLSAFQMSEVDLPTMVFLSPQKLRWARAVGAFDVETLSSNGNAVAAGKRSTEQLSELPRPDEVDCATVKRGAAT